MSAPEVPLVARSPLATAAEAATGWRAPDGRLALTVQNDLFVALVTVARERLADFAKQAVERLGAPVPAERSVSSSGSVSIVAAARGCYLVIDKGEPKAELRSWLASDAQGEETGVDYSDQLAVIALEGSLAPRVLSSLCSIDFDPCVFAEGAAAVTRLCDVRAYVWREARERYSLAVQRSYALHTWQALMQACKTHSAEP